MLKLYVMLLIDCYSSIKRHIQGVDIDKNNHLSTRALQSMPSFLTLENKLNTEVIIILK